MCLFFRLLITMKQSFRMGVTLADIIGQFSTSLHSKFQIRDWLKLTSAERRLARLQGEVNFNQPRIWNLEWSEGRKCTKIPAIIFV